MCLTQLLTPFRAWCTTHFQNAQHHALYIGQMSRKNKLWRNVQKIEPEKRPGGQIIDKRILIVRGKGADFSGFNKGPVSLGFKSLFLLLTSRIPLRFFLSVETEDNHHELYTTVAKKKKKKKMKCVIGERCLRAGNANVLSPPERAPGSCPIRRKPPGYSQPQVGRGGSVTQILPFLREAAAAREQGRSLSRLAASPPPACDLAAGPRRPGSASCP